MAKKEDVSRRDFVKSAGVATAATAVVPPIKAAPVVLPARAAGGVVNYGLIGPGSRGQRLLERHLQHIDIGRCVALCDIYEPNLAKARDLFDGAPTAYTDYRQLLDQSDVEAVFITTPLYLHYRMLRDALDAGKHVFCEKSLVFRPAEVLDTRELYKDHPDLIIQVGLQRRYSLFLCRGEGNDRQGCDRQGNPRLRPVASQQELAACGQGPAVGRAVQLEAVPQVLRWTGRRADVSPSRRRRLDDRSNPEVRFRRRRVGLLEGRPRHLRQHPAHLRISGGREAPLQRDRHESASGGPARSRRRVPRSDHGYRWRHRDQLDSLRRRGCGSETR